MVKADNSYQEILRLVHRLQEEIVELRKENTILKARIHELGHPKNSNNSSIPPSKDDNRVKKNQSLRKSSGRNTGGQKGHKGHTLNMVTIPNKIIDHVPETCSNCGKTLLKYQNNIAEKRQIVELPSINPIYIEHRSYTKVCSCGCENKANFPSGVNASIQYSSNIENLVAYLNVGQYLPYNRIASMLGGLFNLPISQGSIKNMIERFANKSLPFYEKIRKEIEESTVVGADETGAKMNGDKWWFWTWQNQNATYITASDNRAYRTIEEIFPDGFKNATLVSDRYGAHLKTNAYAHQICTSHLFRDFDYLIELTKSLSIKKLKLLRLRCFRFKKNIKPRAVLSNKSDTKLYQKRNF